MSSLIIIEPPLLLLPSLATAIGLNEAIALQQIHYWLNPRINKNYKEGNFWIYNSYEEWQNQFSFWSIRTIRRIMQSLESKKILISKNFNKNNFNKTKWYTINYEVLDTLNTSKSRIGQLGHSMCPDWTKDKVNLDASYKETETTTKNTNHSIFVFDKIATDNFKEREMLNIWNKIFNQDSNIISLTKLRSKSLKQVLKGYFSNDINNWELFCLKITTSDFLMGKITNFKVTIDWVLKEESIMKILENNYGIIDNSVVKGDIRIKLDEEIRDPIWKQVRLELREKLGEGIFKSWISKLKFSRISNQVVYFDAPTKFIREWITNNFSDDIKQEFNSCGANIKNISVN
mgnify:CR=1 FL=1